MTIRASNFPPVRPVVTLDFAATKRLGPMVAIPGGANGTYFDASKLLKIGGAGIPRFHHDLITGESLGLLSERLRTNIALWNRDLTNAAWVPSGIAPAKDQVGLDGITNSASRITATASNGLILQSMTSASALRSTTAYIKRLSGSGAIEMTQNGGASWTAVTALARWSRIGVPSATIANPSIGFRVATLGDSFAVDCCQCENGEGPSTPIFTAATSVARTADAPEIGGANWLGIWSRSGSGNSVFIEGSIDYTVSASGIGGSCLFTMDGLGSINTVWYSYLEANRGAINGCQSGGGGMVNVELFHAALASRGPGVFRHCTTFDVPNNRVASAWNGILSLDANNTEAGNNAWAQGGNPRINIGGRDLGGGRDAWNGPIKKVMIFNAAFSGSTMLAMTS